MKLPWNNGWSCPRDAVWMWELLHVILMHPQNNFPAKLFKPAVWKAKQAMMRPVKLLWKSAMCTALSPRAGWVAAAGGQRIHASSGSSRWLKQLDHCLQGSPLDPQQWHSSKTQCLSPPPPCMFLSSFQISFPWTFVQQPSAHRCLIGKVSFCSLLGTFGCYKLVLKLLFLLLKTIAGLKVEDQRCVPSAIPFICSVCI